MVRRRRKKSLYEVMGGTWSKSSPHKPLQQPPPEKTDQDEPIAADSDTRPQAAERFARWPKRPRIIQLNAERIEISIPYQLAIAILLVIILLLLVVFRLGQMTSPAPQQETDPSAKMPKNIQKLAPRPTEAAPQRLAVAEEIAARPVSAEKNEPVSLTGNNRIVIQTYQLRLHLEPVRQYFAEFGIETEIKKIGDWYYLVTKNKYENPEKPGTDGYITKQKIIEWGAKYKAPPGYETFGAKPFHDAYGMRFDE
jgi:hypothetical protein